ncbi:MAG: pgaA [Ramlibacter sp.]|nr:pgaA [Ramlibacter sp.]
MLFQASSGALCPLALSCCVLSVSAAAVEKEPTAWSSARHDAVITAWRNGTLRAQDLLRQLEDWLLQARDVEARRRLNSDRIIVASEAADAAAVARMARAATPDEILAYALPTVIGAARSTGDRQLQALAVRRLLEQQPDGWDARVQEALALLDENRLDDAAQRIDALARRPQAGLAPQAVNVHELRAALAEARGQPAVALGNYQQVLKQAPQHRHARRAQALLLAQAGTPEGALQQAGRDPALFSPWEHARLAQDALGERLRWAIAMPDAPTEALARRRASLDQVIADGEGLAAEWSTQARTTDDAGSWSQLEGRLTADRMRALVERGRIGDALALHAQAMAAGTPLPWYGKAAAAAAWARHPDAVRAARLYEEALHDAGATLQPPSDVHIGLVHAYVDSGRFREADALMERLLRETPAVLRLSPAPGRSNAEYGEMLALEGRIALDTGRTTVGTRRFDALAAQAPLSAPFRTGLASALLSSDRPQAALAQLQALAHEHPDNAQVQADLGQALLANGWFAAGRREIGGLRDAYAEHPAVPGAVRARDIALGARLEIEAEAAQDGGTLAQRERGVQLRLSSRWSDAGLSIFYRHWWARAQLTGTRLDAQRAGTGIQWRHGPWRASAELHRANWEGRQAGAEFSLGWRPSDTWQFAGRWDSNTVAVPWRAREAGVTGRLAQVEAEALAGDSTRWRLRAERLLLSDDNARQSMLVQWRQGWWQSPRLQLESTLSAEAAGFERSEPAYFSPTRERSLSLDGEARWLTWKRDDRNLVQVLQAGAGAYAQGGFATAPMWSGSYAQEWSWGTGWLLRYGVGVRSHPYDGNSERRRDVFIRVSAPLP